MTDLILYSKPFDWNDNLSEEAIEDFETIRGKLTYCQHQSIGMALAKLELLEKQGQKLKIGHWIRVDKDKLRCSECEVIHLIAQYPNGKVDWCPNCGAKMDEPQEGGDQE